MKIPPNLRNYFFPAARIASGILLLAAIVLFLAAVSFEGYLLALIAGALAGCGFTGAQELKARGYWPVKAKEQEGLPVLRTEDGSSPGPVT